VTAASTAEPWIRRRKGTTARKMATASTTLVPIRRSRWRAREAAAPMPAVDDRLHLRGSIANRHPGQRMDRVEPSLLGKDGQLGTPHPQAACGLLGCQQRLAAVPSGRGQLVANRVPVETDAGF